MKGRRFPLSGRSLYLYLCLIRVNGFDFAYHGVCGEKVLVPFARPYPPCIQPARSAPLVGSEGCRRLAAKIESTFYRANRVFSIAKG